MSALTLLRSSAVAVAAFGATPAAAGEPAPVAPLRLVDAPCAGCRAVLPPKQGAPVPLLVVLHGDYGYGPPALLAAWERHALSRGVGVLALQCPRDQGCKGSWWQWNGDPSWVSAQVDALAAKQSIDRERIWLHGWSGGASYIGLRAQAFQRAFAALVYQGGGIAPSDSGCPPRAAETPGTAAPVFFLVGNANPLHSLAVRLREHHDACNDEVVWQMVPGADHAAEWKALDANGGPIVEWLLTKRRQRPAG